MNKKLMVTLACLMSAQGAFAASWASYVPTWQSVRSMFAARRPQAESLWSSARTHGGSLFGSAQAGWNGVVDKYQVVSAVSAPVRHGYSLAKSNPIGFGVTAYSAGSYPKLVIPALGGLATWYATKQLNEKRHWNLNDSKKLLSGVAGAGTTFAFMLKPKLTMMALALTAVAAYKKGWGPFAKRNNCPGGVCPIPSTSSVE